MTNSDSTQKGIQSESSEHFVLDSLPIVIAEEIEKLRAENKKLSEATCVKCFVLERENKKLKSERDAFQAQAGARKKEIFLLKMRAVEKRCEI